MISRPATWGDLPWLLEGLPRLQKVAPGVTPEWVEMGLVSGSLRALVFERDSKPHGFVLYQLVDGDDVYLAGLVMPAGDGRQAQDEILRALRELARRHGKKTVRFRSVRPGWGRALRDRIVAQQTFTEYTVEV